MKILELFSGYGTASFALKRLGIKHELIGYSDIDKYANQCFQQNHGGKELGDVKLINPNDLPDFDLLTGGFPCQAFSVAGKQNGELDPRGSLFYEIIRIAEVKQPKYMLLENVKGLTCKKFKDTFDKILSELDRIGYNVYWKVLNSKDYGIPQSRARVWFVCFRKNIDTKTFKFPEPIELKIFIKDILEPQVDGKYYLSEKAIQGIMKSNFRERQPQEIDSYCKTLKIGGDIKCINLQPRMGKGIGGKGILTKEDGTVYCIDTNNRQAIYDKARNKETEEVFWVNEENDKNRPSYLQVQNGNHSEALRYYNPEGIMQTVKGNLKIMGCVTTCFGRRGTSSEEKDMYNKVYSTCGQLRRLTPKECFRLMGFLNDEINLEGLSDTQRYKLAGNGQDINMVSLIFKEMFK